MLQSDSLQGFMFENAAIRGQIVHLEKTYQTIINQHPYPAWVKRCLAEALTATVLMTSTIKFEGSLSLQFQSDARFPLMLVQCDHQFNLRGFAGFFAYS